MYFYKNSLKKITTTIVLFMAHSLTLSMDLSFLITPASLLYNNGAFLKKLVLEEAKGYYCPELSKAEDVLREHFEDQKNVEALGVTDGQTCNLAMQLINRYDKIPQLEKAVEVADLELIEDIVKENPYILQCYSKNWDAPQKYDIKDAHLAMNEDVPFYYYTILHTACSCNKYSQSSIEKLLDLGANPNVKTGKTFHVPLHYACNLQVAKLLIKRGACVDESSSKGYTPLMRHIGLKKNASIAAYLLKHKANPNRTDANNRTIIESALSKCQYAPVALLIECAKRYSLKLLIGMNTKITDESFLSEYRALPDVFNLLNVEYESCVKKTEPLSKFLISKQGKNFQHIEDKRSALYYIAQLLLLLQKHTPIFINSLDKSENRIIFTHQGCCFNNASLDDFGHIVGKESVEWALEHVQQHCRDLFAKMKKDHCLLCKESQFYLLEYDEQIAFQTFMFMLQNKNTLDWFDHLHYVPGSFLVNGKSFHGDTLLHEAVRYRNETAIRFFIGQGINFTAKDAFEKTAHDYAYDVNTKKCLEQTIISFLLTKCPHQVSKAQKQFLNAAIIDRFYLFTNPLLSVAMQSNPEWVFELLKHKICVNKTSHFGLSALSRAIETNNEKIVLLLLERGALVNKDMILQAKEKNVCLHKALQEAYASQQCVICLEHPDDMKNVPCAQHHPTDYICKGCYDILPKEKPSCPLCRGPLLPYFER